MNKDVEMYQLVSKNIKKYRKDKNMTLAELSEYTKINKDFLKRFEDYKNDITISIYDLYKISVVLEVSMDKFFSHN